MTNKIAGILTLVSAVHIAFGQNTWPKPRPAPGPLREVRPLRMARILADGTMLGDWVEVPEPGATAHHCSKLLCYDSFEPDEFGEPSEGYNNICNPDDPTERFFLGEDFCGMVFADDMITCPDCAGGITHRIHLGFYLGACPGGENDREHVYIAVNTAEEFDCEGYDLDEDGTVDSVLDGIYEGVVWDLGVLGCNKSYTSAAEELQLCERGNGKGLQLPLDGVGGFKITIARDYIDTNNDGTPDLLIPSECAQPLIWGNKFDNPSHQTANWWVDRNHDELFSPDECGKLIGEGCPPVLGTMIAFFGEFGEEYGFEPLTGIGCEQPCVPCDANCDGSTDLLDVESFIDLLTDEIEPCRECAGDLNEDGSVNLADVEKFIQCLL